MGVAIGFGSREVNFRGGGLEEAMDGRLESASDFDGLSEGGFFGPNFGACFCEGFTWVEVALVLVAAELRFEAGALEGEGFVSVDCCGGSF